VPGVVGRAVPAADASVVGTASGAEGSVVGTVALRGSASISE
jgi:hypothetical protein